MSAQSMNNGVEHVAERTSTRADDNMTPEASEQSSTRAQKQNSVLGAFHVKSQVGAAVVCETNSAKVQTHFGRTSMNCTEIWDDESQIQRYDNLSNEDITKAVASPGKSEYSRRKIDRLVDENARLRVELKALQNERNAAHNALDMMLSDLITAQKELEEKNNEIAVQENGVLVSRQEVDKLVNELDEKNQQSIIPGNETEVLDLRLKVSKLITELEEKERQLKERDNALTGREMDWQAKLPGTEERPATKLREHHENVDLEIAGQDESLRLAKSKETAALAQVEVEKRKAEQYLQELEQLRATHTKVSQTETDNSKKEQESKTLQELQASHAAEIEELGRLSNFFKKNSEWLSRQNREITATNRHLEESVQEKNRDIGDHMSLIGELMKQIEELQSRLPQ